jgi:NitT/TauT family transport system substrate-binding protein
MSLHSRSLVSRIGWLACLLPLWCLGCSPKPAETPAGTTGTSSAGEPKTAGTLRKVKLLLNWYPEAEHGGFYAAQVHGYYRDAGLDVEIVPGGPSVPVVQQVATKQVEFGIVNADPICFGRAQEAPIVALMAPLQTSPRCLIVHEKSGIKKFGDIHDVEVAMSSTSAFSHFLQKKFPFKNVRIVPYPGNVAQFLQNENYVQQGYIFSEPFLAKQQGGDPRVLLVSDEGFNPYTSCLITHDEIVKQDPELARKIVQASIQGWQKYLAEPTPTNELIHSLNKEMSLEVLAFGAQELKPLVEDPVTKQHGLGHMGLERWQTLVDQLVEIGQLAPDKVKTSDLFTTEFLKASDKQLP